MRTVYRGWWVVLVSGIGLMLHYGPVISGTFGIFLKPLSEEFGWSRAEISLGFSLSTLVLSAALPIVGRLLDRFGARRVIVPSLLLFGLGVASFRILLPELWHFYAIYALLGVVGSGTTPVTFSKVISQWFDRRRGIALALIATGSSLGAFILPPFAQALLDAVGWRQAYFLLGLLVIAVTVPAVGLFLRDTPQMAGPPPDGERESSGAASAPAVHEQGLSNREAWRSGTFWLIVVAFFLMSVSFHGCFIHLVPMLTDRGVPGRQAVLAISLLAVGSMTGRLCAGYLLDRFFGPPIAIALFGLATTGILLLWTGLGSGWAFLAATLLGVGMGAEGDIVPYLLSRYFGLRAFGEIYGYAFTAFVLGAVIGPLVMAASFDFTGSYRLVLGVFVASTLTATWLMTRLGSYPGWEVRPHAA